MWTVQRQELRRPKKQFTTLHFDMLVLEFGSLPADLTYFFWVGQDFLEGKEKPLYYTSFLKNSNFNS